MKMRVKCRVWWPKQLSYGGNPDSMLLFGWFLPSSSDSLDVVVAANLASPDTILNQSDFQGILHSTNERMPQFLQDKSPFSILGHCASDCSSAGSFQGVALEDNTNAYGSACPQNGQDSCTGSYGQRNCRCQSLDGFLEPYRKSSIVNGNWIQFFHDSLTHSCDGIRWIPQLHHIHWDGQLVPSCDVHVIIYEPPTFGTHHFSLNPWGYAKQKIQFERPMWVDKLHQKRPLPDLDIVVLAINCATCAKIDFKSCLGLRSFCHRLTSLTCHLVAVLLASFSTLFYAILQFLRSCLASGSQAMIYKIVAKIFRHTWKNIHVRSCQLLYWPVLLQNNGLRSQSNVEYAHRAALNKHSMWSSVAVDILLGNAIGFTLLLHIDTACPWVLNLIHDITNNLLRSGCVWLMGVPAGFKLNTELAEILGMISLNAIQIWSTLWFYLGFIFRHFVTALALSGIIFGATVPSALIIDMILLATFHISILHWLISLIYSHQIKALAALWRLFRGRKWNPLRQRFDSYNYTVKQHVVGSLLFAPLLLLLPTTSVFYIFFTILNTTTSMICILIEVTISILHATPYNEIFLWMVKPRRFPSGIWFEIISTHSSSALNSSNMGSMYEDSLSKSSQQRKMHAENIEDTQVVVSFLRSNFSSIGQVILPHYRKVFDGVSISSGATSAYRVIMGRRIPAALHTGLPSKMPWMFITYKDHWVLCYNAILSTMLTDSS